jgi:hypothetical protein
MKIYCPVCFYKPKGSDRWVCHPGCGHMWHTFDTRGRCPHCTKQWRDTSCPACGVWSKHVAWYHDELPAEEEETEQELEIGNF